MTGHAMRDATMTAHAQRAAAYIRERTGPSAPTPVCGIVLGSGLGGLADRIEGAVRIAFAEVPGFPAATVSGHAGQVLLGMLGASGDRHGRSLPHVRGA